MCFSHDNIQMQSLQMQSHGCNHPDAIIQMQPYRCNRPDAIIQMQSFRCNPTDAIIQSYILKSFVYGKYKIFSEIFSITKCTA